MEKQQKLVWIIGASSGIGASLAQLYTRSGWRVVVSARSEENLEELARGEVDMAVVPLDVTDDAQFANVLERFRREGQLPDLTVFCSGIYHPGGINA